MMSKIITTLLFFFSLGIPQITWSQNLQNTLDSFRPAFESAEASHLRMLISQINFEGNASYRGFLFQRVGVFKDQILITRMYTKKDSEGKNHFTSILISEANLLRFIAYLEESRENPSGTYFQSKISYFKTID